MRPGRVEAPAPDETAEALARELVDATAPHVAGVLLFGSRLAGTRPGAASAYDFVVIVDSYRGFYDRLVEEGHHARSPRVLAFLSRILPPNIIDFSPGRPDEPVAKCIILTERHFERVLSPSAPDHFLKGRMMQSVAVVHARDRTTREWMESVLAGSRRDALRWMAPHIDGTFTAAELARGMLRVSYRAEIRPESSERADEVFEIQRQRLERMYGEVLREAVRDGTVERVGEGRYRLAEEPGTMERLRNRLYFARSKLRATSRWLKYIFTYSDWLEYIRRKIERRTGRRIELTERERKHPFIFLWPKFFHVLGTLPGAGGDGNGPDIVNGDAGGEGR